MFTPKLSDAELYKLLLQEGIHHPEIVVAQAKLETGNYKSKLFKTNNNLFGLKKGRDYAKFNSYRECIKYYKVNIQSKYRPKENYYTFLQRIGYAKDPRYTEKLQKIIKQMSYKIECLIFSSLGSIHKFEKMFASLEDVKYYKKTMIETCTGDELKFRTWALNYYKK